MTEKILIIEDDEAMQFFLSEALKKQGYRVIPFLDAESAFIWLEKERCDLILLDIKLPGIDGIEAIGPIRERSDAIIIVITAFGAEKHALEAIRKGAYDYFTKPFKLEEMEITIKRALEKHRLRRELEALKQRARESMLFPNIIGQSRAIKEVLSQVARVADSDVTALILGETGTGKELIAQTIHDHSPRKGKPFIKLNCVAIPEGLLESELFGHEKGAFTGAVSRKIGKFELADQGTIFLDEIGDMALSTQAKILRILQEKELERVGGTLPMKVDVRVIAATNKNLVSEVREKRFREDLFYRLNVVTIFLPPLRERKEDIPLLVDHIMEKMSKASGKKIYQISKSAMEILTEYSWPGNVRELENVVERAMVMVEEDTTVITPSHLPLHLRGLPEEIIFEFPKESASLDDAVSAFEKELILKALYKTKGVQSQAAQLLGITERSMWHRIKKYAIDIDRIKGLQDL
ncbi:MAG: sigma-54-dependent Fis family transcriptional regulator [Deltaproteobacteria bacterium]|nr:sigma-54-dependent Fis family transcriptional regulator [Deltaproteobacteria bacterium]MBW2020398.1 sigma-54-dependent Fis family transcriptional regulator [Deltaproteobacteria bacterium]MBW2074672.1 sigma-54-dependent Fis family transcriptional regulator [Deltaproteobacteria bacterium]RLB82554.1 MAG: sigma-54-dependent Fis family transcriptional regulator [Deltaproteobacteria bacterium]